MHTFIWISYTHICQCADSSRLVGVSYYRNKWRRGVVYVTQQGHVYQRKERSNTFQCFIMKHEI